MEARGYLGFPSKDVDPRLVLFRSRVEKGSSYELLPLVFVRVAKHKEYVEKVSFYK